MDLPKKVYKSFNADFPYSFEYPVYAKVSADTEKHAEPYWINVDFPKYKGRLHISYKNINNNLNQFLERSRNLALKHISKANSINEQIIDNKNDRVYGLVYSINGSESASSYQFYLTDSTKHFLRGVIFFNDS